VRQVAFGGPIDGLEVAALCEGDQFVYTHPESGRDHWYSVWMGILEHQGITAPGKERVEEKHG